MAALSHFGLMPASKVPALAPSPPDTPPPPEAPAAAQSEDALPFAESDGDCACRAQLAPCGSNVRTGSPSQLFQQQHGSRASRRIYV
eukprot:5528839-Pyramimonas_sp.AAC.1